MRSLGRLGIRAALVATMSVILLGITAIPALATHSVTGYFPASVAAGCYVTINGTNFTGAPTVTFSGPAASPSVIVDSTTRIVALVPLAGAVTGPVTVSIGADVVVGPALTILPAAPCPTVTNMTPSTGGAGTLVSFTGTNFNTAAGTMFVRFGSAGEVAATNVTLTTLQATVPAGLTGSVPVRVTNISAGTGLSPINFQASAAAPTITSFTPTSGPVGTSVTITGTNFTGATSVTFNNVNAPGFTVAATGTSITVAVPTGATTGPIRVTTPGGTATSTTNFTVTGQEHDRTVSMSLSGHIKVTGTVNATDGFTDCESKVGVKIQKQKSGGWSTLTTLQTDSNGNYKGYLPNKDGRYRAKVPNETLLNGAECGKDTSPAKNFNA